MKEYEKVLVERIVIKKTTCDRCGEDCTNTHFDIGSKPSFCESYSPIETICYFCYEKLFKQKVIDNLDKRSLKLNKEEVKKNV